MLTANRPLGVSIRMLGGLYGYCAGKMTLPASKGGWEQHGTRDDMKSGRHARQHAATGSALSNQQATMRHESELALLDSIAQLPEQPAEHRALAPALTMIAAALKVGSLAALQNAATSVTRIWAMLRKHF